MKNNLFQWIFSIEGLIPSQVKLKRKVWLKKGELLLKNKNGKLIAYILGDDKNGFNSEKKITPYLWMSCLISNNTPALESKGGVSISSKDELGTKPILSMSISTSLPQESISKIETYAHKYLGFIGKLHEKYISIIAENEFLAMSLEYFYEAERKFIYSNEGFISAVISMEALFNEGPSDIKYKLSHRAGFLLGLSGIESMEAFEKLKDFYNKRSKLVHGGGNLKYDPDRHLVSRYARRAIISFLILLKNKERRKQKVKDRKIKSRFKDIQIYSKLDTSTFDYLNETKWKYEEKDKIGKYKLEITNDDFTY